MPLHIIDQPRILPGGRRPTIVEEAVSTLSQNLMINTSRRFIQRYSPTGVTAISNGTYGADQFKMEWGPGSTITIQKSDVIAGAAQAGLNSRYFSTINFPSGSASKFMEYQPIESVAVYPLRASVVCVSCIMKATTATTMRLGLISSAGSAQLDYFRSTNMVGGGGWGANGTDPTLSIANLTYVTPSGVPAGCNGSVSGGAITCNLTTSWKTFGGLFVVPGSALNILPAVWADSAAGDGRSVSIAQNQMTLGNTLATWMPRTPAEERAEVERFCESTAPDNQWIAQGYTVGTGPNFLQFPMPPSYGTFRTTIRYRAEKLLTPASYQTGCSTGATGVQDAYNGSAWVQGNTLVGVNMTNVDFSFSITGTQTAINFHLLIDAGM